MRNLVVMWLMISFILRTSAHPNAISAYTTDSTIHTTHNDKLVFTSDGSSYNNANTLKYKYGYNGVDTSAPFGKYYSAHVMVNLLAFTNDMKAWVQSMKDAGYNLLWAHLDGYNYSDYNKTLSSLMDAAQAVGGIKIMPGWSMFYSQGTADVITNTWNHPALFKINGKRVYSGWDYRVYFEDFDQVKVDSLLLAKDIRKDDYYLIVHSRCPYSFDDGATWVGEYTAPNGFKMWSGGSAVSYTGVKADMLHLYKEWPFIDGLINFAADMSADQAVGTNAHLNSTGNPINKFTFAGIGAFYASASFHDFGFKGAARIWDSILALPPAIRPAGVCDVTANDYAELSYISPLVIPPANGLCFIPPADKGFYLGNSIRYPITDHSGIQKFLRPWADAYKNNQSSPTFSEDRMFAWYWLHPKDQQLNPVLPAIFNGYPHLNQAWWDSTVYATGYIEVARGNQIYGINTYIAAEQNKIRMAVHLTEPAQLKINDILSELKPAGPAFFEIGLDSFRGTPTFSIVRSGMEVKKGKGVQPITNNTFPGGWNFLCTEINTAGSYYRSKASGNWNSINTWQSSTDSIAWNDAADVPNSNDKSILIRNDHIVSITDSATIDQLRIEEGGVLTIAPNASITINDGPGNDIIVAPAGKMIVQSGTLGTGTIGNSSGTVSGNVTVERYISSSGKRSYWLLSPTVNTATGTKPFIRDNWQEGQNNTATNGNANSVPYYGTHITGSITGSDGFDATPDGMPSLYTYNQTAAIAQFVPAVNTNATNMEAKKGYLMYIRGDRSIDLRDLGSSSSTTLRATGQLLTGTQKFNGLEGNRHVSLLGNPFASPLYWSAVYNDSSTANALNFENYYTYLNPDIGMDGGYVTVNTHGMSSDGTVAENPAPEIQSGQAFFVRAKAGTGSPALTIHESHKSPPGNTDYTYNKPLERFATSLYFSDAGGRRMKADAVNVIFDNRFSTTNDEGDAEEMANWNENIALSRNGKMLCIEVRPVIIAGDTLPLVIQNTKRQDYQWQFEPANFNRMNLQAFLEDKYQHARTLVSLTAPTVVRFSVGNDPASAAPDRFSVIFVPNQILPATFTSIKAYQKETSIQVDWTAQYNNAERYEVEKSFNGQDYIGVATITAQAGSLPAARHSWLDLNPAQGNNYYRIKAISQSGPLNYSNVVNVSTGAGKGSIHVYPNPAAGDYLIVQFNNMLKGAYVFKLANSEGRIVVETNINHAGGSSSQTVPLDTRLARGTYTVQITGKGVDFTKQMLK